MADVAAFRAVRYARPTPEVTAPPYDVITTAEREALAALDPHNVVRLTLADGEEEAGRRFREWLAAGVLVEEDAPSVWALAQEETGPDGVRRRREGIVASLRVEPYERRVVLPHERTHAGPRESRLRLLRAARAQLEPIFLLYDGDPPLGPPPRPADLEAAGTRLWRARDAGAVTDFFAGRQLLIADGHHRYETALAYHAETGTPESARILAVLVATSDPGLAIFPTHRVFAARPDIRPAGEPVGSVAEGLAALAAEPYGRAVALAVTAAGAALVRGGRGQLDVELVDRFGHDGISYTPDAEAALAAVSSGAADVAFLLRATRIEDVFERARRGEVLPQKTTYFFPKLRSGLLFHPV